jgi:DNA (cytosine-5)-methyltransferase 1
MSFAIEIDRKLNPKKDRKELVLDLFAGCGGLALGFEANGFETIGYEQNPDACSTYNKNLIGHCEEITLTPDFSFPDAKIVIGGPPCQPFSVGGKQLGLNDSRDGFPIFISAIKQAKPEIFLFENVRGLLYRNRWYLDEIIIALESLDDYKININLFNAVKFGVPQNRERLIVVGHRGGYKLPKESPGRVTVAEALGDMATSIPKHSKFLTPSQDTYIKKYEIASKCINPRDLHLDKPARTLTCRNLAGATGDMHRIRLPDGRRRRITIEEAAMLQTFPSWYKFSGAETSCFNQIGNAVPPLFSYHLAKSFIDYLDLPINERSSSISSNLPLQKSLEFTF